MSENHGEVDKVPESEKKNSLSQICNDLTAWMKENATTIINSCRKPIIWVGVAFILSRLISGMMVTPVAAHEDLARLDEMRNNKTYTVEMGKVSEELRKATIQMKFLKFKRNDFDINTCTGTVLEQVGRSFTAVLAKHCLLNDNGELDIEGHKHFSVGSSPEGQGPIEARVPYEIFNYMAVPDQDMIFIAFDKVFDDDKQGFVPLGNKLKAYDPILDINLDGLEYPAVGEGWPIPVVDLSTKKAKQLMTGEYSVPVEEYVFSPGGSGTGLGNKDNNIVAVEVAIRLDLVEVGQQNRKIILEPVTEEDIDLYNKFLNRISVG
jgi:hypothetical protein